MRFPYTTIPDNAPRFHESVEAAPVPEREKPNFRQSGRIFAALPGGGDAAASRPAVFNGKTLCHIVRDEESLRRHIL